MPGAYLTGRVARFNLKQDGRPGWLAVAILSALAVWPLTLTAMAGKLSAGDEAVVEFVLANRHGFIDMVMLFFSWAASEYVTPVILGLLMFFGWKKNRRMVLIASAVAASSTLWQIALKALAGRLRPEPLLYSIWSGAGFPSGHILTALVLTYLLWRISPQLGFARRVTAFLGWLALIYPLLVGLSRIYLNCHYLSDVTAGFFLGAGHLGLTFLILGTGWISPGRRDVSGKYTFSTPMNL